MFQCNKCGTSIETPSDFLYHIIDLHFKYGSEFDTEKWEIILCESCLLEIIKNFKITPNGFAEDEYTPLVKTQRQSVFEDWKQTGIVDVFGHITYEQFKKIKTIYHKDIIKNIMNKYFPQHINDKEITRIIINGKAGAGKDTLADYLVDNYGFKKLAFADGIYNIAHKYFGMEIKDRKTLQMIGQKMREIKPKVWVDYTFEKAEKYDKVVITDCRQENEYNEGIAKGYFPIRINADTITRIDRLHKRDGIYPDIALLENECETGADNMQFTEVDNNGGYQDLYEQINNILNKQYIE